MIVAYQLCPGLLLLWWIHGISLTPPSLFLYLCLDFLPSYIPPGHWLKQFHSSTNRSRRYSQHTEGHPIHKTVVRVLQQNPRNTKPHPPPDHQKLREKHGNVLLHRSTGQRLQHGDLSYDLKTVRL